MGTSDNNLEDKIIGWIDRNRALFGQKILCSGLGDGPAMHLAHLFPSASVVRLSGSDEKAPVPAGDSGGKAEKAPAQGLRMPLLIKGGIENYEGGLFDTVIAFTPGPLLPAGPEPGFPRWERGTFYLRRATLLMEYYEKKAHSLRRHLRPGGVLLNLVRSGQDEYLLGYCLALAAEEMAVDPGSVRQVLFREGGERQILQGITARAGGRTDIQALIAENLNFSLDRMNTSSAEYEGRGAEILLQADAGELIRGYHIYRNDELMGKLAVYSSVRNQDGIYYFTDVAGDVPYLKHFHIRDRETVLRHMTGELHRQKAAVKGIRWCQLEQQEDWSETEI